MVFVRFTNFISLDLDQNRRMQHQIKSTYNCDIVPKVSSSNILAFFALGTFPRFK